MNSKKILAWLTTTICAVVMGVGFSSCKAFEYDGNFFDKEHLQEHLIPNLPQPSAKAVEDKGQTISYEMTEEEYDQYAREVYEYMLSCNFVQLGTPGRIRAADNGSDVHECFEFEEYKHDGPSEGYKMYSCYIFAWANEPQKEVREGVIRMQDHFLMISFYEGDMIYLSLCDHIGYPMYTFTN